MFRDPGRNAARERGFGGQQREVRRCHLRLSRVGRPRCHAGVIDLRVPEQQLLLGGPVRGSRARRTSPPTERRGNRATTWTLAPAPSHRPCNSAAPNSKDPASRLPRARGSVETAALRRAACWRRFRPYLTSRWNQPHPDPLSTDTWGSLAGQDLADSLPSVGHSTGERPAHDRVVKASIIDPGRCRTVMPRTTYTILNTMNLFRLIR